MVNQILVGGEWVDGEPTVDGQIYRFKIPVGNDFGYQMQKYSTAEPPAAAKFVGMGALGELLPSAVRTEIRGYALDTTIGSGKRKAAGQIVNRIHSNEQTDANGDELTTLLSLLVTHTALTQAESDAVLEALQA